MPPIPKLHVPLSAAVLKRLDELAATAGVPAADYAGVILGQFAIGSVPTSRGPSQTRSVTANPDDVPAGVERAASGSGFAGVTKFHRAWRARAGGETIGTFSSPELAAIARYYAIQGFRVGRGAYLAAAGMSPAVAYEMAAKVMYGALPPAVDSPSPAAPAVADEPSEPPPAITPEVPVCIECGYSMIFCSCTAVGRTDSVR